MVAAVGAGGGVRCLLFSTTFDSIWDKKCEKYAVFNLCKDENKKP